MDSRRMNMDVRYASAKKVRDNYQDNDLITWLSACLPSCLMFCPSGFDKNENACDICKFKKRKTYVENILLSSCKRSKADMWFFYWNLLKYFILDFYVHVKIKVWYIKMENIINLLNLRAPFDQNNSIIVNLYFSFFIGAKCLDTPCILYCENGDQIDANGCKLFKCNDKAK